MIQKTFRYRIYPTEKQKELIEKHFGATRWVYNWGLQKRIEYYQKEKKTLNIYQILNELVKIKKREEYNWLNNVSAHSLQQSLFHLDQAYTRFFREKKGFPKFKSKKNSKQSFASPQDNKIDFNKQKLYIMKFKKDGGLKIRIDRQFEGKIKSVTVSKTPTNKYFAAVLVETLDVLPQKPQLNIEKAVGLDLGISSFLTTSTGNKYSNPKFLHKSLKKLRKVSRSHSRKKKGSNNKNKSRLKLARVHEKITNQRKDFLNKITIKLVSENQTDTFCLENLDVEKMLKNKQLSQQISDASWSEFVRQLKYKSDWYGKNIIQIGQYEPSSKICNNCGTINQNLKLSDRIWQCSCGSMNDRDVNAAKNIRDIAFSKQNLIKQEIP